MKKYYLQNGDKVYTTGAYLRYCSETKKFELDKIDEFGDTLYFDGLPVNFDGKAYIEEKKQNG